jgi:hypothetical protein
MGERGFIIKLIKPPSLLPLLLPLSHNFKAKLLTLWPCHLHEKVMPKI